MITLVLVLTGALVSFWCLVDERLPPRNYSGLRRAVGAVLLAAGGYSIAYHNRPQPPPLERELFVGVHYRRRVVPPPDAQITHFVEIDLDAPGIRPEITPPRPTEGRAFAAKKVSTFLREQGLQLAINGGYFRPWFSHGPLWYYPHEGDPVDVLDVHSYHGRGVGSPESYRGVLSFSRDGRATIDLRRYDPYLALGGTMPLVVGGHLGEWVGQASPTARRLEPRTAVGVDASGRRLLILVVDGRQPGYSEGMSMVELAETFKELGFVNAIALDGGGSSTLVIEGSDGHPMILNSPIHGRVPPGRERPVANHLGFHALRLDQSGSR